MENKHAINWASATVEPVGDLYELRVELSAPEASEAWVNSMNREATRRYQEERPRPWGSIVLWGDCIVVCELEPGAEDALKRYLAELLEGTDASSSKTPSREDEAVAEDVRRRMREAAEMAQRFRT